MGSDHLAILGFNACHLGVQKERRPIPDGILSIGDDKQERVYDAFPWDVQPAFHLIGDVRLHLSNLFFRQILDIIHPVPEGFFLQHRQHLELLIGNRRKNGPDS